MFDYPMYCSHSSISLSIPAFAVIPQNDDVWPGYRLARRKEVERNIEKVKMVITDEWAIVSFEDGEILGM